jgi:hypothetical protein
MTWITCVSLSRGVICGDAVGVAEDIERGRQEAGREIDTRNDETPGTAGRRRQGVPISCSAATGR